MSSQNIRSGESCIGWPWWRSGIGKVSIFYAFVVPWLTSDTVFLGWWCWWVFVVGQFHMSILLSIGSKVRPAWIGYVWHWGAYFGQICIHTPHIIGQVICCFGFLILWWRHDEDDEVIEPELNDRRGIALGHRSEGNCLAQGWVLVQLHKLFQTSDRYNGECRNVKLKLASLYVAWVVSCFSRFTIQITMRLVLRQDCLLVALDDPLGPGIDSALVVGSSP